MTALIVIEAVVIVLLTLLVAGLLRSHAEVLRRLHALDGGEEGGGTVSGLQISSKTASLPDAITGTTPDGAAVSVALKGSRGLVLLAFLSTGCTTCRPHWKALGEADAMPTTDTRPVIVTKDAVEESASRIAELAPPRVTTVMSSQAWDDLGIPVSPYFLLLDASNGSVIGQGAASSWAQVSDLLRQALADAGRHERGSRARTELSAAGLEPGDDSLYRNPHGKDE